MEMQSILTSSGLISLLTLVVMEIVLGIDNVIFISLLTGKLPPEEQGKARFVGMSLALVMRICLLFAITWLMAATKPVFTFKDIDFSARDLILLGGGIFLIYKSTSEIHEKVEGHEEHTANVKKLKFGNAIFQIILLDIVFSFDSILTAVGLVDNILTMIIAVVISMGIMLLFAKPVSEFVHRHPTVKMLALSFLLMIGFLLTAEAFHVHVPKGYVYFAMAFSFFVELLNLRAKRKREKAIKHD